ncbi:hypothetical protein FJZ31_04260 [Candidatus Poribacteria bacterium]|nr:hypothetical protein [Candidatus Poribacteria bacterium]
MKNAHPSGSPRNKYIKEEARRLIEYAEKIFHFCSLRSAVYSVNCFGFIIQNFVLGNNLTLVNRTEIVNENGKEARRQDGKEARNYI